MIEIVDTMPQALKPAATNRVARYMYYSLHNTTDSLTSQVMMLADFLPAYSNSIQRLKTVKFISNTTTNPLTRANMDAAIRELTSIPTNRLNGLRWLSE